MKLTLTGIASVQRELEKMRGGYARNKRNILSLIGKRVAELSRKRVQQQIDIEGRPFTPRADGGRKKMLVRSGRSVGIISAGEREVVVGIRNPVLSRIAAKHQVGFSETMTARDLSRRKTTLKKSDPATRRQAKALRELGFKTKVSGRLKQPTLRWITENMTMGKAGAIIRAMRGESKQSWTVNVPARAFFGMTAADFDAVVQEVSKLFMRPS